MARQWADDATPDFDDLVVAELLGRLGEEDPDGVQWAQPPASVWDGVQAAITVPPPRFSRRTTLSLAALGVVVGATGGGLFWRERPGQVISRAVLRTLDTQVERGTAELRRRGDQLFLVIDTPEPFAVSSGYIEVWLINTDGEQMLSVGVYSSQQQESFPLTQSLIDEAYTIVDISAEDYDGVVTHSGNSFVRGQLQ